MGWGGLPSVSMVEGERMGELDFTGGGEPRPRPTKKALLGGGGGIMGGREKQRITGREGG